MASLVAVSVHENVGYTQWLLLWLFRYMKMSDTLNGFSCGCFGT